MTIRAFGQFTVYSRVQHHVHFTVVDGSSDWFKPSLSASFKRDFGIDRLSLSRLFLLRNLPDEVCNIGLLTVLVARC